MVEVRQKDRVKRAERHIDLVQAHRRPAARIEQELLAADLDQRCGTKPLESRLRGARPEQGHFEILSGSGQRENKKQDREGR